jgi:hypothetical protein
MGAAFYIAVEDDLSDAVVRRLLIHARRGFQICGRYPLSPMAYLRPELSGYGYLKANVRAFNKAAKETPHFLLTDLDEAACAPELMDDWIGGALHPNFVLRVAVRGVEAWLLADINNMADFLGLTRRDMPTNIETVSEPKEEIVRLASISPDPEVRDNLAPRPGSTATTGRLFTRSLIGYVRDRWDVNAAAAHADSLRRAVRALHSFKIC